VTVEKTISLTGATLACAYRLTAPGAPFSVFFAPELNLTLLAGDAPDRYYRAPKELQDRRLASRGESEGSLELVNEWDKFLARVSAQPATTLWRHPLETASQSEGGFERTYQGSVILPIWRQVTLGDGKWFEATVQIELVQLA
jgi:alpha-amylase